VLCNGRGASHDIYSHVLPQADQEAADRSVALIER
jgi:hypothetical protein